MNIIHRSFTLQDMRKSLLGSILFVLLTSCSQAPQNTNRSISDVMDDVITRLYEKVPPEKYADIEDNFVLDFLQPEERKVLSTRYQYFKVNVPVTVSLMRHVDQKAVPFWLPESGFKRTDVRVKNDTGYEYEVWQKNFPAGNIELGVNGFDKHRPVYFVCVGPQNPNDVLTITDIYPSQYELSVMKVGAFTYHDWSDLVLTEVPDELVGQQLFTTVRGRAREAHVVGAFRKTPYPTSSSPDHIVLTWSRSPKTTIDIQWRTNTTVGQGAARYWMESSKDTLYTEANRYVVEDRMLFNDRYLHRFTAEVKNLRPGKKYHYQVGSKENNLWSDVATFQTEPENTDEFVFVWFGDTHTFPDSGRLVTMANDRTKDAAFFSIAGDLVSTGLNRDDWDKLFEHSRGVFSKKPVMPVPGNHDRQDGLGAKMYYDMFSLPQNGPDKVDKESTYSFEYGNALFLMIDATQDVDDQTEWIEKTLSSSKATWKFAMFHFPPYNFEEPYPEIQEAWVPLFDKYHVDMVMGGHVHYYMRSKPMNGGKVVDNFSKGTVYAISISIPTHHDNIGEEPYAVQRYPEGFYFTRMDIKGNTLKYTVVDSNGNTKDEFEIRK